MGRGASMARRGSPPVTRASAPQSSTTAAAASQRPDGECPAEALLAGARAGPEARSRARRAADTRRRRRGRAARRRARGAAKLRYTNRSFTRSSRPRRDPERERPPGASRTQRRECRGAPHANTGSRSASRARVRGLAECPARAPPAGRRGRTARTRRRRGRTSASRSSWTAIRIAGAERGRPGAGRARSGTNAASSASPAAATFTTFWSQPSESTWPQMLNGDGRLAW